MYDAHRRETGVPAQFHSLKAGERGSCDGFYLRDRKYHPARLCAVRKSPEEEEAGLRRPEAIAPVSLAVRKETTQRRGRRKGRGEVSAAQKAYNRYVVPAAILTVVEPAAVSELYRQRQQAGVQAVKITVRVQRDTRETGQDGAVVVLRKVSAGGLL